MSAPDLAAKIAPRPFRVEDPTFDPPVVGEVKARNRSAARMAFARMAHDAGYYRSVFDAVKNMRATVVGSPR